MDRAYQAALAPAARLCGRRLAVALPVGEKSNSMGQLHLFRTSFLLLYMEVFLLRWVGAFVPFASFFTHHVLLGALLGVSLGFFLAGQRERLLAATPGLLLATLCAAAGFHLLHAEGLLAVRVGNPDDPERLFFGTVWPSWQERRLALPIEASLLVIFAGTALVCAGLGQRLGTLFASAPRRIPAYAVHLGGCVAGILSFTGLASLGASPVWWVLPVLALLWLEVRPSWRGGGALALCLVVVFGLEQPREGWTRWWSPYNRVDYLEQERLVFANGIGHQQIVDQGRAGEAYALPYAGLRPRRVLVIGAGTGNDVAIALSQGAEQVDAVEIDPVLAELGRRAHPDRPYASPRVRLFQGDGRAFLEDSQEHYDLIVYGLVDSLTLHSSYGSVRLESYLFTREAFAAARSRLAPGGHLVVTNYLRSGWLALRIAQTLEEVFGAAPSVFTLPEREFVAVDGPPDKGLTILVAGEDPPSSLPLGERSLQAASLEEMHLPTPTDDWPYPYLRSRAVPAQNLRAIGLLAAVAVLLALGLRAPVARGLDRHFLFLGTGFALIETTSLARLAAVLGTTWQMHAAVVAGVLITSLVGTAWAAARPQMGRWGLYAGLATALALSAWCDAQVLLSLPPLAAAAVLCAPLLFSGALFTLGLARCERPAAALGSNAIGVLIGVALEALTVVTGLRGATGLVAAAYALSLRRR